ncbi:MAG TPA: TIGR02285 family protein [Pseudomonas sp.]|nr:TIGR02285 family protein [Pseudomonas sp.]
MKRLNALLFALLGIGSTAQAETIIWLGAEFPPMAMSQGPHAHQGYINALFGYLQQALPQHQFSEQMVPWSRAMHMAEQGGPYCMIAALKTPERETFLRFTEPYGHFMPLGLVVHQEQIKQLAAYLNPAGQVELERLLDNRQIRLGIASGRSYGDKIDNLLQAAHAAEGSHLAKVHQGESTRALFGMLDHRRIDYSFGYPTEIVYFSSNHQQLRFYPIAGNDQLLAGRFSCTRSKATDQVFADITRTLENNGHQAVFKTSYERWLPDYLHPHYQRLLKQLATQERTEGH